MASLVVGTIYYGLMFILAGFFLLLALIFPKKAKGFFIAAACIVVLFVIVIPLWARLSLKIMEIKERPVKEAAEKRYNEARAVFDEQCKKAGEKIYRTVDNVDGVMLLKLQGKLDCKKKNCRYEQMWEDAAIGGVSYASTEEKYIKRFLNYIENYEYPNRQKYWVNNSYQYVDVLYQDTLENKHIYENSTPLIVRYTRVEPKWKTELKEEFSPITPARYAVTYENNVDPELRKYWIAGTTIKIIDRQTNELLAEKTIFAFHGGLGVPYGKGHDAPWWHAIPCGISAYDNVEDFAITVLKPKQLFVENAESSISQPLFMETQN